MNKLLILFLFVSYTATVQNTLSLNEDEKSPAASLASISWMEGHWKGEAFGGITEEIWSPALGGSMMFSFKLVVEGKVEFYELGHIRALNKSLIFELKHFGTDLTGWEEKNEVQRFKLIKVTDNRLYFDGFTFEKVSDNEINIYALIHQGEKTEEVTFNYLKQ